MRTSEASPSSSRPALSHRPGPRSQPALALRAGSQPPHVGSFQDEALDAKNWGHKLLV